MAIKSEAPRVSEVVLPELTPLDISEVESHARYDARLLNDVDLSGRDLEFATFDECQLSRIKGADLSLRGLSLIDCALDQIDLPVLAGGRAELRGVTWRSSRVGSADLFSSSMQGVHFIDCRLGFINLRGAKLEDVFFTNCTIDELDLGQATAKRVGFSGTTVRSLDISAAKLHAFDLRGAELSSITGIASMRGAIVDSHQLMQLAPLLAEHFGVAVRD